MPVSFDGFCSLWPEADLGVRMRRIHTPPAIFTNVFDVYNFSIISNLFDSEALFASYLVKHTELGSKILNKICEKIIQKH